MIYISVKSIIFLIIGLVACDAFVIGSLQASENVETIFSKYTEEGSLVVDSVFFIHGKDYRVGQGRAGVEGQSVSFVVYDNNGERKELKGKALPGFHYQLQEFVSDDGRRAYLLIKVHSKGKAQRV